MQFPDILDILFNCCATLITQDRWDIIQSILTLTINHNILNLTSMDTPNANNTAPAGGTAKRTRPRRPRKANSSKSGESVTVSTTDSDNKPEPAPVPASAPASAAHGRRAFTCPICLQEADHRTSKSSAAFNPVNFISIGSCDHVICSLCALRMRGKSKDDHCTLCKASLHFMFVFPVSELAFGKHIERFTDLLALLPFPWPQDLSRLDLIDVRIPGCMIDVENKLIYVNCPAYFTYMEHLKALHCPIRQCAVGGFRNIAALLGHLTKDHSGSSMCKLCLEHRPLFISEHEVFASNHKLKQHMLGHSLSTTSSALAKNAFLLGHPECLHCKVHYFDPTALYRHMQLDHFTCNLCDSKKMFRYYKNIGALREHHLQMHFVCNICHKDPEMRRSDIQYAFKQFTDFSQHLRSMHHLADANRYLVTPVHKTSIETQDLDMGTASPFPRNSASAAPAPAPVPAAPLTTHYRNSILSNIPSNMTIAGRVSGTGRFAVMDTSEQEAMQTLLDDHAHPRAANRITSVGSDQHFPHLSAEDKDAKTIHQVHPLSLINRKPPAAVVAEAPTAVSRKQMLADAFGLSSPACAHHHRLAYLHLSEHYLCSCLYPSEAVAWAKRNKGELLKIENKLVPFLQSADSNSLQLKPMAYALRGVVHLYAKYSQLNSYEYDAEPKRYVSLVRRPGSCLPRLLLSSAMNLPTTITTDSTAEGLSVLYFVLKEGQAWTSATDKNKPAAFNMDLLTVGQVLILIHELLEVIQADYSSRTPCPDGSDFQQRLWSLHREIVSNNLLVSVAIDSVQQAGPHAIGIGMHSRYAAALAMIYLQDDGFLAAHLSAAELFRYYKLQASFPMPAVSVETSMDESYVSVPYDEAGSAEDGHEHDAGADDDFRPSADYVLIHKPNTPVPQEVNRAVAADWEEVADTALSKEDEDWERFLAAKRAGKADAAVYQPRKAIAEDPPPPSTSSGIYVPKKTNSQAVDESPIEHQQHRHDAPAPSRIRDRTAKKKDEGKPKVPGNRFVAFNIHSDSDSDESN